MCPFVFLIFQTLWFGQVDNHSARIFALHNSALPARFITRFSKLHRLSSSLWARPEMRRENIQADAGCKAVKPLLLWGQVPRARYHQAGCEWVQDQVSWVFSYLSFLKPTNLHRSLRWPNPDEFVENELENRDIWKQSLTRKNLSQA